MLANTKLYMTDLVKRFRNEEEGLALTEYMILLGLLTAVVIGAVTLYGENLGDLWQGWAEWLGTLTGAPTT
ncbi:Flp family type IVb pilin [Roseovarius sp.]|uniref:Flp family type IVb pilin n=1 Tax=Roseovarius sp. TaxID=1486281 RepID=UPI003A97533B